MKELRELLATKGRLGLWKVNIQKEGIRYRITDDGSGYCNSIEEMSSYYKKGTEIDLVKEILDRDNKILFENIVSGEEKSYEDYLEQFNTDNFPIVPYINFITYEKAKEIWDLLEIY